MSGPGQPPAYSRIIGRVDGELVTAGQRIPELLRAGMYLEPAAAAAGVQKNAVYTWLKTGAMAFNRRHTAEQLGRTLELTPHEQACLEFNDAVVMAEASWETEQNVLLGQLSRGGLKKTTETATYDRDGNLVDRQVKTEILPPNPQVIEWRLTRRFGERYGNKIEVSAPDRGEHLTDVDVAGQLIDSVEEFLGAGRVEAEA